MEDNSIYLIRVKWNKTLKASNNNWYILNSLWTIIIYNFLWRFEIITFKARNGLKIKNRTLKKSDVSDEIDWTRDETTKNSILESNESFSSNWQYINENNVPKMLLGCHLKTE